MSSHASDGVTALFFASDTERPSVAASHRDLHADCGSLHLPSACLNEVTEVGWPAKATPVRFDPTPLVADLYDHETREARLEASRKWKAANREKCRAYDRERLGRLRGSK